MVAAVVKMVFRLLRWQPMEGVLVTRMGSVLSYKHQRCYISRVALGFNTHSIERELGLGLYYLG